MKHHLIEQPDRIAAFLGATEIIGACLHGKDTWALYLTDQLTEGEYRCHPVACSREGAKQWIEAYAKLFTRAAQRVWSPDDTHELALRAAQFDAVDCSGSLADLEDE